MCLPMYQRLVVTVTIHDAEARRQSFGQIGGAFMRIINAADNSEIARFDLSLKITPPKQQ
jgi:tellurium resistance protein TerD